MDQFGVLVESIGFKAHGKSSAPMADLKSSSNNKPPNNNHTASSNGFPGESNSTTAADDLDAIFGSNTKPPTSHDDDVFGGLGFGAFQASSYNHNDVDDVFGLSSNSGNGDYFDVLGNRVSPVVKTKPVDVDDLIGSFGGINNGGKQPNYNLNVMMKSSGFNKTSLNKQETASEPADLLSGFGVNTSSVNGRKSEANTGVRSAKSFSGSADDPFGMFETTQGSTYNGTSDYLDSLFSSGAGANTRSNQSSTTEDSVYDSLFNNNVVPKKQNKASSNSSKPNSSTTDDFSYLFGMGVAPTSGEFQEIEGESEERRKARYSHHMATRKRMNDALHEKNKRDLQAQQEQDEKHRVAATLDGDIKRWAVGKEGNLRALISSLQHVLWAGSGWQPISLTDLITSTAVKKAYYKATLCVHPDKVQQKGASVQQKYIAEKVFDLLKGASQARYVKLLASQSQVVHKRLGSFRLHLAIDAFGKS